MVVPVAPPTGDGPQARVPGGWSRVRGPEGDAARGDRRSRRPRTPGVAVSEPLWICHTFEILRPNLWRRFDRYVDPWLPFPPKPEPDPEPDPIPWIFANGLVDAALGAAMYAVASRFRAPDPESLKRAEEPRLEDVLGGALDVAVHAVRGWVEGAAEDISALREAL